MKGNFFIEVWDFVEKKMNCTVPKYFKNVLKACGFENAITIASIEDEDIKYFENEVRNGNVSKYYLGIAASYILDGSTRTEANFEFTRGHKHLLRIISDYLKGYAKQNSGDSVIIELDNRFEERSKKATTAPSLPRCIRVVPNEKQFDSVNDQEIFLHQSMLTCKVIMNLIRVAPTMYAANIESINQNELVEVEVIDAKLSILEAIVNCPFCYKRTRVLNEPSGDCKFLWNTSPLDVHLETDHQEQPQPSKFNELNESIISQGDQDNWSILDVEQIGKNTAGGNNIVMSRNVKTSKAQECCLKKSGKECTVGDCKPTVENAGDRSYSKDLKIAYSEILNSKIQAETESNKSLEIGKKNMNNQIQPKEGNYVVCSLLVKDTIQWPSIANFQKYFVGKICQSEERFENEKCIGGSSTMNGYDENKTFDIQFLNKHRHCNFIFYYPDQFQTSRISGSKIVKILLDPVNNRRGGLVFKDKEDKAMLDSFF